MNQGDPKFQITKWFNVLLFIFLCFAIGMDYLFEPKTKEMAPWDTIYNIYPVISIVIAVALGLLLLLGGAKLFQRFWNSFISDVFKARDITFQEALAIILITGIIVKGLV